MAIWYAIGLTSCAFVSTAFTNPFLLYAYQIGMQIRVICTSLIYRKVIDLSGTVTKLKKKITKEKTCFIRRNKMRCQYRLFCFIILTFFLIRFAHDSIFEIMKEKKPKLDFVFTIRLRSFVILMLN